MAQFTAQGQGRLKPLGVEPKDPYHCYKFGSGYWPRFQTYGPKLGYLDSNKLYFTSLNTKSNRLRVQARLNVGDKGIYDDDVHAGDDEFEMDELACFRGLVLDLSYRPVNVVCWRRAICLEFMEKADVLEYYDQTVNSPSGSFYIPAVLRVPHLLQVVKRRRIKNNLSRKNIFYRDNFTCQYCSSCQNLTVDHVLPIARGGEWTWENLVIACTVAPVCKYRGLVYIQFQLNSTRAGKVGSGFTPKENVSNDKVTACAKCNSKKGQKTLEEANMKLSKVPKAPKDYDILAIPLTNTAIKMLKMRNGTPEEWRQYLSKSSSEP